MSDAPPQLGDIPRTSDFHIPQVPVADSIEPSDKPVSASSGPATMSTFNETNVAASVESAKNTVVSTAQSAMETVANHPITQNVTDTIANHPITQNVKETVTNGPVAQNVKEQASKTSAEASKLAESRKVPDTTAATGQPLTHYHSFFYNLLTWEHPRVTAISYISIITSIFILRYVPVLRITFKILAYALGTTALVEGLSQAVFAQSILAAFRPKKYFVLPRETLESTLEDVEQLLNFFVIESQRLLFAEDASKTAAAFLASLIGYWLIKFTPLWGLSLIAVTTIYFIPLIYILNKELIDEQLAHASKIVNAQTAQMKDLAAQHTAQATESLKVYAGDLSNQASEYIGSARRSISPAAHRAADTVKGVTDKAAETVKGVTEKDFPTAPKQEPIPSVGVTTTADQVDDEATKIATGVPAS